MERHKHPNEVIDLPIELVRHPDARRSWIEISQELTTNGLKERGRMSAYFRTHHQGESLEDSTLQWIPEVSLRDIEFTIITFQEPPMPNHTRSQLLGKLAGGLSSLAAFIARSDTNDHHLSKKRHIQARFVLGEQEFSTTFYEIASEVDHESAIANIKWFAEPANIIEKREIDLAKISSDVVDYNFDRLVN